MAKGGLVASHDQILTVRLVEHIPAHGPRGPQFEAAKRRMKALGLNTCAVQGCDTKAPIEYHHSIIEHAWQGGVDVMPEPLWNSIRVWRDGLTPPAEHLTGASK